MLLVLFIMYKQEKMNISTPHKNKLFFYRQREVLVSFRTSYASQNLMFNQKAGLELPALSSVLFLIHFPFSDLPINLIYCVIYFPEI